MEEDQIKDKNLQISELQEELHKLTVIADQNESHIRRRTQEVNEFIFQLEKYNSAQAMLSSETIATIDRYKQ